MISGLAPAICKSIEEKTGARLRDVPKMATFRPRHFCELRPLTVEIAIIRSIVAHFREIKPTKSDSTIVS